MNPNNKYRVSYSFEKQEHYLEAARIALAYGGTCWWLDDKCNPVISSSLASQIACEFPSNNDGERFSKELPQLLRSFI